MRESKADQDDVERPPLECLAHLSGCREPELEVKPIAGRECPNSRGRLAEHMAPIYSA